MARQRVREDNAIRKLFQSWWRLAGHTTKVLICKWYLFVLGRIYIQSCMLIANTWSTEQQWRHHTDRYLWENVKWMMCEWMCIYFDLQSVKALNFCIPLWVLEFNITWYGGHVMPSLFFPTICHFSCMQGGFPVILQYSWYTKYILIHGPNKMKACNTITNTNLLPN